MEPGSPEWELELCRRECNMAGRRVREAQTALDAAVHDLVSATERYGRADEAVRHGGYGPEPDFRVTSAEHCSNHPDHPIAGGDTESCAECLEAASLAELDQGESTTPSAF